MTTPPYKTAARIAGLTLLLAMAPDTQAADHFDGNDTGHNHLSDIADFYVFPTAGGERLTMIINTAPRAGVGAKFSDAINYGFRIRPAALERNEAGVANKVGAREFRVSCAVDVVDEDSLSQRASCGLFDGTREVTRTSVDVDDHSGGGNPDFKVFAGLRADPFFTDAIRVRLPRPRHRSLPSIIGTGNSMRPAKKAVGVNLGGPEHTRRKRFNDIQGVPNVLSFVVELDVSRLLDGEGPRFAVVAETTRRKGGAQ